MSLLDALLLDPAPFNVWIAKRTDGLKGSGTASDPYDGSTQARFDGVMSFFAAQSNVAIHLGPGEFQTNGYNDTTGWQARPGMKIVSAKAAVRCQPSCQGGDSARDCQPGEPAWPAQDRHRTALAPRHEGVMKDDVKIVPAASQLASVPS